MDPVKYPGYGRGQGPHRQGFGQTGDPFKQDVPVGQEGGEQAFDRGVLPHDDLPNLLAHFLEEPGVLWRRWSGNSSGFGPELGNGTI